MTRIDLPIVGKLKLTDYLDANRILIRGVEVITTDRELIVPADKSILERAYSGTLKTVTETTATLKDSCGPTGNKKVFYPLGIRIYGNNPTGSGVTLTVEPRLYHSDGSESPLTSFDVAEGNTKTVDYVVADIQSEFKDDVAVVEVRLYAYCSATPAEGKEPEVRFMLVSGIQF